MKHSLTAMAALLLGAAVAVPVFAQSTTPQNTTTPNTMTSTTPQTMQQSTQATTPATPAATQPRTTKRHVSKLTRSHRRMAKLHRHTTTRVAHMRKTTPRAATTGVGSSTPPAMSGSNSNLSIPPTTPAPANAGNSDNSTNGNH